MITITDLVRQRAKTSGLPITQIAKLAGVSVAAVSRFVSGGDVKASSLGKIATVFGAQIIFGPTPKSTRQRKRGAGPKAYPE